MWQYESISGKHDDCDLAACVINRQNLEWVYYGVEQQYRANRRPHLQAAKLSMS